MSKSWWFERKKKKKYIQNKLVYFLFVTILIINFCIFVIVNDLKSVVSASNDSIDKKYTEIFKLSKFYKYWISPAIWKVLLDYRAWKNILKEDDVYIKLILSNKVLLSQFLYFAWLKNYASDIQLLIDKYSSYQDDIFSLLWKDWKKVYLLLFENTSEVRADWWFVWSFAKLVINGAKIERLDFFDSYYLLWKSCWWIKDDDWWQKCDKSKITEKASSPYNKVFTGTTFINWNIYGFSDLNWQNIIKLYNKWFDDRIDWVVFIKSDILNYLFEDGKKIWWEMEFINMLSVNNYDIKKHTKENLSNKPQINWLEWKKSNYLLYLNDLLKNSKSKILLKLIKNYNRIVKDWIVRVYLPNISSKFRKFLVKENLIFERDDDLMYIFEYNIWNNKTSKFVNRIITINWKVYDSLQNIRLSKWLNKIKLMYQVHFSEEYVDYIEKWFKKYNIELEKIYLLDTKYKFEIISLIPAGCEIVGKKHDKKIVEYFVHCNLTKK